MRAAVSCGRIGSAQQPFKPAIAQLVVLMMKKSFVSERDMRFISRFDVTSRSETTHLTGVATDDDIKKRNSALRRSLA